MALEGIPVAALDFFDDLEADNSKSFWLAHKAIYDEQVKAPLEALAAALAPEFGAPKLFRPYRDVRFSRDKTPYKTQQGVWFDDSSMYLHVDAAGLRLAAGYWRTTPAQVGRLRRAIDNDVAGAALVDVIAALAKAKFEVASETVTRVPSGYDKEHPRADLLRFKTLTAHRGYGCPPWLSTARARTEIAKGFRALSPLAAWLDTHVGHD